MPINNKTLQDLQEKLWYVIKSNNNNTNINIIPTYKSSFRYILKRNDIIKLGRIKFLIRDMNLLEGTYDTTYETFRLYEENE
jgi:hypothetical protein